MRKQLVRDFKICYLGTISRIRFAAFSVPQQPENWRLEVSGKRTSSVAELRIAELTEFANCRDEIEAVQRYVRKFGPPVLTERVIGNSLYAVTRNQWRSMRCQFR